MGLLVLSLLFAGAMQADPPPADPPVVGGTFKPTTATGPVFAPLSQASQQPLTVAIPAAPDLSGTQHLPDGQPTPYPVGHDIQGGGMHRLPPPIWLEKPDGPAIGRYYPVAARQHGVNKGRAVMDCRVLATGRLSCTVASESPRGYGFGAASLKAITKYRMQLVLADGTSFEGAHFTLPMDWWETITPVTATPRRHRH
jgi:protein TonB